MNPVQMPACLSYFETVYQIESYRVADASLGVCHPSVRTALCQPKNAGYDCLEYVSAISETISELTDETKIFVYGKLAGGL